MKDETKEETDRQEELIEKFKTLTLDQQVETLERMEEEYEKERAS